MERNFLWDGRKEREGVMKNTFHLLNLLCEIFRMHEEVTSNTLTDFYALNNSTIQREGHNAGPTILANF